MVAGGPLVSLRGVDPRERMLVIFLLGQLFNFPRWLVWLISALTQGDLRVTRQAAAAMAHPSAPVDSIKQSNRGKIQRVG